MELLLKTYAVNVAVGMWDDYWCNQNNYYLYFNTSDKYDYRFWFIPYDYDNTLGTSGMIDSGRQDPLNWGDSGRKLIRKLLDYPEYKAVYLDALHELCSSDGLFGVQGSMARTTRARTWSWRTAPPRGAITQSINCWSRARTTSSASRRPPYPRTDNLRTEINEKR